MSKYIDLSNTDISMYVIGDQLTLEEQRHERYLKNIQALLAKPRLPMAMMRSYVIDYLKTKFSDTESHQEISKRVEQPLLLDGHRHKIKYIAQEINKGRVNYPNDLINACKNADKEYTMHAVVKTFEGLENINKVGKNSIDIVKAIQKVDLGKYKDQVGQASHALSGIGGAFAFGNFVLDTIKLDKKRKAGKLTDKDVFNYIKKLTFTGLSIAKSLATFWSSTIPGLNAIGLVYSGLKIPIIIKELTDLGIKLKDPNLSTTQRTEIEMKVGQQSLALTGSIMGMVSCSLAMLSITCPPLAIVSLALAAVACIIKFAGHKITEALVKGKQKNAPKKIERYAKLVEKLAHSQANLQKPKQLLRGSNKANQATQTISISLKDAIAHAQRCINDIKNTKVKVESAEHALNNPKSNIHKWHNRDLLKKRQKAHDKALKNKGPGLKQVEQACESAKQAAQKSLAMAKQTISLIGEQKRSEKALNQLLDAQENTIRIYSDSIALTHLLTHDHQKEMTLESAKAIIKLAERANIDMQQVESVAKEVFETIREPEVITEISKQANEAKAQMVTINKLAEKAQSFLNKKELSNGEQNIEHNIKQQLSLKERLQQVKVTAGFEQEVTHQVGESNELELSHSDSSLATRISL